MKASPSTVDNLRDNLITLRVESLKIIALAVGAVGYVCVALLVWPVTGDSAPLSAWIGALLLVTGTFLSLELKGRHLHLATHALVWGIWGAAACAVLAFPVSAVAYLFILPVTFASVLLSRWSVFLTASASALAVILINLLRTGSSLWSVLASGDVALPTVIIVVVTMASWLSARNLYIALTWVWNGYRQARHNECVAREHQAELRRVLKALDEASYRIERANYMATLARDQAVEARRLKQRFAQNISHELRTPLNLIVGFTELMVQSPEYYGSQLPAAYLRDLSIVHRNATHLQTLVNDVLDLARIESAQMGLVPELTDPADLVRDAVATARSLIETRGLTLHTEIAPDLPLLWIDPTRIRQVLFNLLNNAARFTEEGSVTVRVRREDEQVIFAVADTGIGIAPDDIPHIFQEFHQIDGSTRRRHGGAGLGLAISHRFVRLHGGRIWVESQVGRGSTFYFNLPVNQADPVAAPGSPARATVPDALVYQEESRILLAVTPSTSAAALLTRYLHGYRIVVVPNLQQARHAARQLIPQVVVVDTACSAFQQAQLLELAQVWRLPQTTFVACPLPGEEPVRQHLAVDGYLIKPISRQALWDVLRQFGEDVENILVVDDNRDFVRLVRRLMDSPVRRYQVTTAYSGQEGLAMMRHRTPDLVLLDLVLPDLDGYQFIEQMRLNPAWQQTPIVVVSAQEELSNWEALQGSMVVSKVDGLVPGELVQWIQQVLDTTSRRDLTTEDRSAENGAGMYTATGTGVG